MIKVREFNSFNERRYGNPWIARIVDGKINFDTRVGGYTGEYDKGEEGYLYLNNTPKEGELFAYGQKDYRNPRNTFTHYLVYNDGEFVKITRKDMLELSDKAIAAETLQRVIEQKKEAEVNVLS